MPGINGSLLECSRVGEKNLRAGAPGTRDTNQATVPITYGFLKFLRQFSIRIFINIHFTEISFALHFHNKLIS